MAQKNYHFIKRPAVRLSNNINYYVRTDLLAEQCYLTSHQFAMISDRGPLANNNKTKVKRQYCPSWHFNMSISSRLHSWSVPISHYVEMVTTQNSNLKITYWEAFVWHFKHNLSNVPQMTLCFCYTPVVLHNTGKRPETKSKFTLNTQCWRILQWTKHSITTEPSWRNKVRG